MTINSSKVRTSSFCSARERLQQEVWMQLWLGDTTEREHWERLVGSEARQDWIPRWSDGKNEWIPGTVAAVCSLGPARDAGSQLDIQCLFQSMQGLCKHSRGDPEWEMLWTCRNYSVPCDYPKGSDRIGLMSDVRQVLTIQGTDHGNIKFLHQSIIKVKVQHFGHMGEELMSHVTLLMHYKHSPAANLWWCSAGVWWEGLSCRITSHLLMSFGRISSASARSNELWELAFCVSWCARMWSWILIHKGIRESREAGKSQPLVHLLIHYRGYLMKFPWGHSFPASVLCSDYLAWGSADQDTGHAVKRVFSTFVFVQFLPKTKSSVLFQNKAVCNSLKVCNLYNIEAWNLVLHAPYTFRHAALFDLNTYTQQINTSQRIWI